jgi:chemotaxis protein methyltransferase CheR
MIRKIPEAQLLPFNELVARRLGLHFPRERWVDLERGVCAAAEECGCREDVEGYLQGLLWSPWTQGQMEILVSHLTIGETYFFREKRSLEILEERIVPDLLRARPGSNKELKIWSAGCATGEEPYSIAIMLSELMPDLQYANIEILATDLNTKSLRRASQGVYTDWSFRGTPQWVRRRYFKAAENGRCAVTPAIRKRVTFAQLNLMDDTYAPLLTYTSGFDVIFCRNVLMYFTPEGMRKVVRQLYRYLATDGWLIVSPTETSQELFAAFATASFGDVTLYKKSAKQLPVTLALRVHNEGESGVQLPAWAVGVPDALRTSTHHTGQEIQHKTAGSVITELPAPSYEDALGSYEQGRYEEAEQATATLLSKNRNDTPAMFLLARIYANQGKLAEALVWCNKAIAADKMSARAHYLRASILQEQSSIPEAILALKQAVYAEPQFVLGHFALGNLALKHGRLKESEKYFENVLLLLARYEPEDVVPESEGLSAGRLREMIFTPSTLKVANQTSQSGLARQIKLISSI